MGLCEPEHLTHPSCDFIPFIYKMVSNYFPCSIAGRIKWIHCEKVLIQMLCKRNAPTCKLFMIVCCVKAMPCTKWPGVLCTCSNKALRPFQGGGSYTHGAESCSCLHTTSQEHWVYGLNAMKRPGVLILWSCWNRLLASRCKERGAAKQELLGKSKTEAAPRLPGNTQLSAGHKVVLPPMSTFTCWNVRQEIHPRRLELGGEVQARAPESYHFQPLSKETKYFIHGYKKSTCDDRTMGYDPKKVGNILEHSASLTGNFYFW